MLRNELVDALASVARSLGDEKSTVPIEPCFCFADGLVFTFDAKTALVLKTKSPLRGGVRGLPFLGLLKSGASKEVEVTAEDGKVIIKAGRSKQALPLIAESEFLFAPPDLAKAPSITLDDCALNNLARVRIAMGTDTKLYAARCGVQAILLEKEITLFTSNESTAARVWFEAKVPKALRGATPLFHSRFVEILLEMAPKMGGVELYITPSWYAAKLSPELTLYSAVPEATDVPTFEALFKDCVSLRKKAVAIPKTWWAALRRADIMLGSDTNAPADCSITDKSKMVLKTISALGTSRDVFTLDKPHVDASVRVPPATISKAEGSVKSMVIVPPTMADGVSTPNVCVFFGGCFDYIVASGS